MQDAEQGLWGCRGGDTHYTANMGTLPLRKALQQKLQAENGLEYGTDEIVVSNGAKQAIWQGLLATCSPGDEVIARCQLHPCFAPRAENHVHYSRHRLISGQGMS